MKFDKLDIINIMDCRTRYGERAATSKKDASMTMEMIESEWVHRHGAPKHFSADPEFCRPFSREFLKSRDIQLHARPSRSSSKNSLVERNNGIFITILKTLERKGATFLQTC